MSFAPKACFTSSCPGGRASSLSISPWPPNGPNVHHRLSRSRRGRLCRPESQAQGKLQACATSDDVSYRRGAAARYQVRKAPSGATWRTGAARNWLLAPVPRAPAPRVAPRVARCLVSERRRRPALRRETPSGHYMVSLRVAGLVSILLVTFRAPFTVWCRLPPAFVSEGCSLRKRSQRCPLFVPGRDWAHFCSPFFIFLVEFSCTTIWA